MEWTKEGHRNYPLIGRAPPYSALHILADHASKAAEMENSDLLDPSKTRRSRSWADEEISGKVVITDDPNLPPPSPTIFGINRKDFKKNFDLTAMQQSSRKKHYQHLKPPPPPPNVKIQHLYQTLNAKRSRKSLTKKASKARVSKQSAGRMHLPYPPDEKHYDGTAELQRHLTSQLMPPPMSPMKSPYAPILPAGVGKKDMNLIKTSHEPQAHYIPNSPTRLKSELLGDTTKARSGRGKNVNLQARGNYQPKYANGAGARNMDHIPDPRIIFNTTSTPKIDQPMDMIMQQHNNHDIELSQQAMASPLQLLSTAASCTPKLKVNPHHLQQQPSTSSQSLALPSQIANKTIQNRAIKIIPASSKPVIIKPTDALKTSQPANSAQSSKFKIQKIQLVMNKNQDGTSTTANLSPSATIVSGKAGQLLLSGKGITNSYQVSGKLPYTIVSAQKASGPKVIVQTIDKSFSTESSSIPENQRITENTPIDFMPSTTTSYPKVIIQKPQTAQAKQIKLKLGGSLVNPKIIKGPIPGNLKIQRNVNTKGFTVMNSSQIVQLQAQVQQTQLTQITAPAISTEGSKVDWEQELDDVVNRKGGKSSSKSNGPAGPAAKKARLDETEDSADGERITDASANVLLQGNEKSLLKSNSIFKMFSFSKDSSQSDEQSKPNTPDIVSEFVFLNHVDDVSVKSVEEGLPSVSVTNGEVVEEVENVNQERQPQNGAEAYESLVKSLTECDADYMMKDIVEDTQMEENFELIDNNILDQFSTFSRDTGLFQ